MSESSDYPVSSGAYWLRSRSYRPATPVPWFSPFHIGLWMRCLWIGSSVSWIRSTIRACVSRWGLSTHLLPKVYLDAHEPSLALADPPGTRRPWHSPSLALAVVAPGTRRLKLALNYVLKLKYLLENQLTAAFFETKNVKLFEDHIFFLNHLSASVSYLTRRNKKWLTLT